MDNFTPHQLLLMKLRDDFCAGNAAELARRIKKDSTYVNRLFYPDGKKGKKGIGLEIMEACSISFDLPPGFWDVPYATRKYQPPTEAVFCCLHCLIFDDQTQYAVFGQVEGRLKINTFGYCMKQYLRVSSLPSHQTG